MKLPLQLSEVPTPTPAPVPTVQQAFATDWPTFQAKIYANEPGGIIGRAINAHMDDLKQAAFEIYSVAYYRGQQAGKS